MSIFDGMGLGDKLNVEDFAWHHTDLIFSYNLKSLRMPNGMMMVVEQQETGFSLTIQLQETDNELLVRGFTINEMNNLEQRSLSLYDAALVEIVLQAIDLMYYVADHHDVEEITFHLPKEEADHLLAFDCFFDRLAPQDTNRVLKMPASKGAYDVFVSKTEVLKTKMRCELWGRQRHEPLLKKYLQSSQKSTVLAIHSFSEEQPTITNNVIAFNSRPKSVTAEKVI